MRRGEPLPVGGPFHLESTVRVLQRRPANLIDTWDGQYYRRTLPIRGRLILVEVSNRGTIDAPRVALRVLPALASRTARTEVVRAATRILGVNIDASAAELRARVQPQLWRTAVALRGLRPPRYPDLFEAFANVIPFQQLSIEAGMAVTSRLVRRFGQVLASEGRDHFVFPVAEDIADRSLRDLKSCGLSTGKALALRTVARAIACGDLKAQDIESLRSAEAIDRLRQLPGIGPWSASLVLLRGFGRLDVFPPGDSGAEKSLTTLMRLRSATALMRVIDHFGDYRGYLYFYGIASRLLARGLITPAPTLASAACATTT
jgi:3-methyladenine DNA glycosylase/8-oxoguanine DNA glycosylase